MPIAIHTLREHRLRYSVWTGIVTDDELLETYGRMLADAAFDATFHDLVDASRITHLRVTARGIWQLARAVAKRDREFTATRVAIVVRHGAPRLLARLYTFYREAQGAAAAHEVFVAVAAAIAWLELPADVELPGVE